MKAAQVTASPQLVRLTPHYVAKPWGGNALQRLFGRDLPQEAPVGESWECVDLPDVTSHVAEGPLSGVALPDLLSAWGKDLLGDAEYVDGRFPLLIKFLDARETLSVQLHPNPNRVKPSEGADDPAQASSPRAGYKHEAWYVLDAAPDAVIYAGLKPGVDRETLRAALGTPAFADLVAVHPARPGDCFYLPSGTVHALGASLVVAEVQTPSDITYRCYDWQRVGLDGAPRELHLEESLANFRDDVTPEDTRVTRAPGRASLGAAHRAATCNHFVIDHVELPPETQRVSASGTMRIWITLSGSGVVRDSQTDLRLTAGQTILCPASTTAAISSPEGIELLEVTVPTTADER